ncbi:hypothetical protein OMR07_06075 [Methylobacterium organophilum]|nr:hypothetical protein [Methylobacterium organophilum]
MEICKSVIFIPPTEHEAKQYLSILENNEHALSIILARDCPEILPATLKLRHLVGIGACEEMTAVQNLAFEAEIEQCKKQEL